MAKRKSTKRQTMVNKILHRQVRRVCRYQRGNQKP